MTQPRQTDRFLETAPRCRAFWPCGSVDDYPGPSAKTVGRLRGAVRLLVLCMAGLVGVSAIESVRAGVVLRLRDGRQAVGNMIHRSAGSPFIVLTRRSGQAVLTRRIAVDEIDSVEIDGRRSPRETLLRHLDSGQGTVTARQPIVPIRFQKQSSLPSGAAAPPSPTADAPSRKIAGDRPAGRQVSSAAVFPAKGCCAEPVYPILGLEAVVIGVQDDPLNAYRDDVRRFFPHGVPLSESGFARDVLRERRARKVIESDFPNRLPGPASLPDVRRFRERLSPPPQPKPTGRRGSISDRWHSGKRIRGITVDAIPISSQGRTDWDALLVDVRGFDRSGRPAPIDGTLATTLWGESQRLVRSFGRRFGVRRGRIRQLATWTRAVRSDTERTSILAIDESATSPRSGTIVTGPGVRRFLLPLPRPLPDHDPRTGAVGSLHVRLTVPGRGVFEATRGGVLLKHISPMRDRALMQTGSRFFANESTFGGRRVGPLMSFSSSSRPNGGLLPIQP